MTCYVYSRWTLGGTSVTSLKKKNSNCHQAFPQTGSGPPQTGGYPSTAIDSPSAAIGDHQRPVSEHLPFTAARNRMTARHCPACSRVYTIFPLPRRPRAEHRASSRVAHCLAMVPLALLRCDTTNGRAVSLTAAIASVLATIRPHHEQRDGYRIDALVLWDNRSTGQL